MTSSLSLRLQARKLRPHGAFLEASEDIRSTNRYLDISVMGVVEMTSHGRLEITHARALASTEPASGTACRAAASPFRPCAVQEGLQPPTTLLFVLQTDAYSQPIRKHTPRTYSETITRHVTSQLVPARTAQRQGSPRNATTRCADEYFEAYKDPWWLHESISGLMSLAW